MTDWHCPNCRGGFPDPERLGECPWCGQTINGSYEYEPVERIARVEPDEDTDDGRINLGELFG